MVNALLITAIREAGLDISDIADIAQVDARTVQRWIGGRVPRPRYRQILAQRLAVAEVELWPGAVQIPRQSDLDEILGAWARRNDRDAPDPRALLRGARQQVDLLGYTLSQILEIRGIEKQLRAKASQGSPIRIVIAAADCEAVLAADLAGRPPGRLIPRVRSARSRLLDLQGQRGLELREHNVATSHTMLRFDEQMLLTIHLHDTPGLGAPMLHLQRERDYGLFDQLAKHFEDIWDIAQPLGGAGGNDAARQSRARERDRRAAPAPDPLDQLDYVWRPGR